jgi:hypothetical protein
LQSLNLVGLTISQEFALEFALMEEELMPTNRIGFLAASLLEPLIEKAVEKEDR